MNTCQGCWNRLSLRRLSSEMLKVAWITNKKTVSVPASNGQFSFLGVCFYSYFNSLSSRSSSMFKESLQGAQWQVPLLFVKKENQPKRPLVITRCNSLSIVVTRCHSLSLVVIRYHSVCHSSIFLPMIRNFNNNFLKEHLRWLLLIIRFVNFAILNFKSTSVIY